MSTKPALVRVTRIASAVRSELAWRPRWPAVVDFATATLEALERHALDDAERACDEAEGEDGCYLCAARFAAGQRSRCDECRSAEEARRECPACDGEGCDADELDARVDEATAATRDELDTPIADLLLAPELVPWPAGSALPWELGWTPGGTAHAEAA